MRNGERHVVVVGAGIAGLAAAHTLVTTADPPRVSIYDAAPRCGGKIRTSPFAGLPGVDEGADSFLLRVPAAVDLARAVGLGDHLVSPASQRAAIWYDRMHDIPSGLLLGMPTGITALARSGLLPWKAKVRAATEAVRRRSTIDHDTLGTYVRQRFGNAVHERLVDPLIGSIYAADTDRFSLTAIPQIAELAKSSRSVLLRRRSGPLSSGPVFATPLGGMCSLTDHVATAIEAAGGRVLTDSTIDEVRRNGATWRVNGQHADAVVLACPASEAARLIGGYGLSALTTADVALITLAVPAPSWPSRLAGRSGYLVARERQRTVTAVSFGSHKWAHWATPQHVVLRVSLGRDGLPVMHLDDEQLLQAAIDEVSGHIGVSLQPTEVRTTRWVGAFPQYRPHHHLWVAAVESALPPGAFLAGASYHGIGVPACISSGQRAAHGALQRLEMLAD